MWAAVRGPFGEGAGGALAGALAARLRADAEELLPRAYSCLSIARAAALLGVGEGEVAALAAARGWAVDADGALRLPPPPPPPAPGLGAEGGSGGELATLAAYVLQLEEAAAG